MGHWQKPRTLSELRAYLGFCNYYSAYIDMYAAYTAPILMEELVGSHMVFCHGQANLRNKVEQFEIS